MEGKIQTLSMESFIEYSNLITVLWKQNYHFMPDTQAVGAG